MKILLFGKNGQVGWELNRSLLPLGKVVALGRDEADFSKPEDLREIIKDARPDVIVNAVAYTNVDKAEEEERLAVIINSEANGVIAEEAKQLNALFIHYSTDYVFDGTKKGAYVESDQPNPLNAYGRSKLSGEKAIQQSGCDYLIFRTSWVYASRGNNFLATMLRLFEMNEGLSVVGDQRGKPTWARVIADLTLYILVVTMQRRRCNKFSSGLYHLASSTEMSWYEFAKAIHGSVISEPGNKTIKTTKINEIDTKGYPKPAKRPGNSVLSCNKLEEEFGVSVSSVSESLSLCLKEMIL